MLNISVTQPHALISGRTDLLNIVSNNIISLSTYKAVFYCPPTGMYQCNETSPRFSLFCAQIINQSIICQIWQIWESS